MAVVNQEIRHGELTGATYRILGDEAYDGGFRG